MKNIEFKAMSFLGMHVNHDDPNKEIDQILSKALKRVGEVANTENASINPEIFNKFEEFKWRRPNPPYHLTSLFITKKGNVGKPEYDEFEEGVNEKVMIKGVVIVDDFLATAFWFPQKLLVENKCPHITMLLKKGKAFDSNMVLEYLFKENHADNVPDQAKLKEYFESNFCISYFSSQIWSK